MKLQVKDAAVLLQVSEKTIYRWISRGKIPFHRVNQTYRFNRAELLEWATANRIPISPDMMVEPEDTPMPCLSEALKNGGIYYRVEGQDKAAILHQLVQLLPLPEEVDREFLYQALLARESMGSTAIGNGIAIPHVRNPIILHVNQPLVALCFLEQPIEFEALDGLPVHTLFTIVSPTIKAHLNLLSRISFGLRDPEFSTAIQKIESRKHILLAAQDLDDLLTRRSTPKAS